MAPLWMHPVTRTFTGNFCSAIKGRAGDRKGSKSSRRVKAKQADCVEHGGWCRGLLLEEKPELKRVLEQRRLELHREEEMAQRPPSDLETELRKRQQKLEEVRTEMTAANQDIFVQRF